MLAGSTALAQAFGLLATPFLTRLYSPEDFGQFAIYTSILSLFVTIVSLRYEMAITLPDDDSRASNILELCINIAIFMSILSGLVLFMFRHQIPVWFNLDMPYYIIYFLPFSLFSAGGYQILSYWVVRKKNFTDFAKTKIVQSLSKTTCQLIMGFKLSSPLGLVLGEFIGNTVSFLTLWKLIKRRSILKLNLFNYEEIKLVAERYKKFPMISSSSSFINQAGITMPSLLLANFFGVQVVGWYSLVQSVFALPMNLIGDSILKVYTAEAAILIRNDRKALSYLYITTVKKLFIISMVPAILLFFFSPFLFSVVFGENWIEAGSYVKILIIPFTFRFAVSPVSQTLTMLECQGVQFLWDISRLALMVGVIIFAGIFSLGPTMAITLMGIVIIITQISQFVITLHEIKTKG